MPLGARFNALHSVTLPCFGQSRAVAGIVPLHITLMRFMLVHHPPRFMSAFRDSPGLLFPIMAVSPAYSTFTPLYTVPS